MWVGKSFIGHSDLGGAVIYRISGILYISMLYDAMNQCAL